MRVDVTRTTELWFGPSDAVRAASGVAPLGDGWVVAQDDATHAAWWRPSGVWRIRLFPPVAGADVFSDAAGTKHLKPDVEAACPVEVDGHPAVLLLGSGSLPARTRAALVVDRGGTLDVATTDLAPLYAAVAETLPLGGGTLNLEGACVVGERLRWFQRGHGRQQVPSASVDLDAGALVDAVVTGRDGSSIVPHDLRRYDLGTVADLPLTVTDAVTLPDGLVVASATAEDAPDAIADGPVAGSAVALLGEQVEVASLPPGLPPWKIEGLALLEVADDGARLLAVVDQDDPTSASLGLELDVRW